MKQKCLKCEKNIAKEGLFCQETYCPAELSPYILDYGEYLGDIEIVKPVTILRSAVLYEAHHQGEKLFLKVTQPGEANKERLKREAQFLSQIQATNQNQCLPEILPPYSGTTLEQDVVGKVMLGDYLFHYYLFKHKEGKPLRDWLEKNPQPWINHVGWLMIGLADAISLLHHHGWYHFGLSPETILVDFYQAKDKKTTVPRILLIDLGWANTSPQVDISQYEDFVLPAYMAPELLQKGHQAGYTTDVYGLGLILYELLEGQPAYEYKLRSDAEIKKAIDKPRRDTMNLNRYGDVTDTARMADKAIAQTPSQRFENVQIFTDALIQQFGNIPPEAKSWLRFPSLNTLLQATGILLTTAFVAAVIVSFF